MRKSMFYNKLHRNGWAAPHASAFSLAELVISMGILVLMLSLAGQVFNMTIQSTGQATALTDVTQSLRILEQTLRNDLAHVHPGRSVLLIQGNPVNAYWTAKEREADDDAASTTGGPSNGYPHIADPNRELPDGKLLPPRADMLMFFTEAPGASLSPAGGPSGVTSNLQQIVYGHADLGEYFPNTSGGFDFQRRFPALTAGDGPEAFPTQSIGGTRYPSTTRTSADPAENWHLARRNALLLPTNSLACVSPWITALDDPRLLDATSDLVCFDGRLLPSGPFSIEDQILRPQWDATTGVPIGGPWFPPAIFGNVTQPYASWIKPFARSQMDPTPPPTMASRLAHYMLPRCASFKVEWSLDPGSEFVGGRLGGVNEVLWFDPGDAGDLTSATPSPDPLRSLQDRVNRLKVGASCPVSGPDGDTCRNLESLLNERTEHLDGTKYSLSDRFRTNGLSSSDPLAWVPLGAVPRPNPGNLVMFTATRPGAVRTISTPPGSAEGEPVPDDLFPQALRITVDVFDRDRRLDRPIRHVMVIPIGE